MPTYESDRNQYADDSRIVDGCEQSGRMNCVCLVTFEYRFNDGCEECSLKCLHANKKKILGRSIDMDVSCSNESRILDKIVFRCCQIYALIKTNERLIIG